MNPQASLEFEDPPVIERVSRRARRIRLHVRPDGGVVLTIPQRASRSAAYQFLEQNRAWIARQHAKRRTQSVPRVLRWDGSDRLPLRGRELVIEMIASSLRKPVARFDADAVRIHASPATKPERLRRALVDALREETAREAKILLDEESARLGISYREISIRDPRSRWGSCSADGRIMLSLRLLLAPAEVFRYVAIHELCHLRWRGHGPRFWGLVAQQMPEFETQRAWLRRHGDELQGLLASE
ncbi:MAG: SprT family zinc-dependent metalloprotease [Pseudomonadota bacterium]